MDPKDGLLQAQMEETPHDNRKGQTQATALCPPSSFGHFVLRLSHRLDPRRGRYYDQRALGEKCLTSYLCQARELSANRSTVLCREEGESPDLTKVTPTVTGP